MEVEEIQLDQLNVSKISDYLNKSNFDIFNDLDNEEFDEINNFISISNEILKLKSQSNNKNS